jgi:hypothetical protein
VTDPGGRDDFRLRRLSGRTSHSKASQSGCEPGSDRPDHGCASRLRCWNNPSAAGGSHIEHRRPDSGVRAMGPYSACSSKRPVRTSGSGFDAVARNGNWK